MKYPDNLEEIVIERFLISSLNTQKEYINKNLKDGFKLLDIILKNDWSYIYMGRTKLPTLLKKF